MNLYEVSVYLAKIFQFSNSATVDDHTGEKTGKTKMLSVNSQETPEKRAASVHR